MRFILMLFLITTGLYANAQTKGGGYKKGGNSKSYSNGIVGDKPQQRYGSDYHRNNFGKIIFSRYKVFQTVREANLSNTFTGSDFIYARVFAEKSPQNTDLYKNGQRKRCNPCVIEFEVFVNGKRQPWVLDRFTTDADDVTWTTRQLWVRPSPGDEPTDPNWLKLMNQLPAGEHLVKIAYRVTDGNGFNDRVPSATGEFKLVKEDMSKRHIGKSWGDISAGMQNPTIESKVLALANNDRTMTGGGSEYLAIKILSSSWRTVKNKVTGVPIYRWIEVNIKEKKADGSCYVQNHAVRQEYNGSGYDSRITWAGIQEIYGYGGPIDCD